MMAVAEAPDPNPAESVIVTLGAVVYPVPAWSTAMELIPPTKVAPPAFTRPLVAVAVAGVPAGPLKVTVGRLVYPNPLSVIVIPVTTPFATVATAVAPVPPPPSIVTVGGFP